MKNIRAVAWWEIVFVLSASAVILIVSGPMPRGYAVIVCDWLTGSGWVRWWFCCLLIRCRIPPVIL